MKLKLDKITEKEANTFNDFIDWLKKRINGVYENIELISKYKKKLKKTRINKDNLSIKNKKSLYKQKIFLKELYQLIFEENIKHSMIMIDLIGYYNQQTREKSFYGILDKYWNVNLIRKTKYEDVFVKTAIDYILSSNIKRYKLDCFVCSHKVNKNLGRDLTWLHAIGVDNSRKSSHYWNFNSDAYVCPICSLVYSCVPVGFSTLRSKGLFINQNSSIDMLIKINNMSLNINKSFQDLEEETYYNIVASFEQSNVEHTNREIDNIQIVKLDVNNKIRPYTFNMLSKDKLQIIYLHRKRLKNLIGIYFELSKDDFLNLYSEVLKRLYNNQNQFDLISTLFKLKMEGKFKNLLYIEQIIKINNGYLGGIMGAKYVSYKKINDYKGYGLSLRKLYNGKENKLGGITYRLLNALKTKDTSKFMDTLINSYLYLKARIPTDFVDALQDIDKFQTIGYAFVLGLQGTSNRSAAEKNENSKEDVSL